MDILQTTLSFILALTILVGVHEFGHFYVARLCGVRVLRFCIGLGTPFWSIKDKHGTEFGIAPFPLGGYVKMLDEREGEVPPEEKHLSYNNKSVGQRVAILAAGPIANFILAFFIFWVVLWTQGVQSVIPIVSYVERDSIADKAGIEVGQEIVAIDQVPTPTKQDVYEQLMLRIGESGTMQITVAQPDSDLRYELDAELNGWLRQAVDPDIQQGLGIVLSRSDMYVSQVVEGGAGEEAGLKIQDKLVAMEGRPILSFNDWVDQIRSSIGQPMTLDLERDGELISLDLTPKAETQPDGSVIGKVGVGVYFGPTSPELIRNHKYGFFEALPLGLVKVWDTSKFVLVSFKKLLVGEISTKNLSGPIGIAKVAGDYAKAGIPYFIDFLAILSVYLGILNLLPIPILDGGHIFYCLIEAVKGSPLSMKVQNMGYSAGLFVLAGVMIVAFYNDILKL